MSTTIDQRVVEMRFDNKHFENNVQTTMSTLDKLKQKLNLTGASKGLDEVNSAAKRVDMSGLGKGVESVSAKFSAMDVIGVTALANITNQAVNAGKRIMSALTIDPVKTGFQEYETQINAVQTILANTSSKGTTIDQVNEALDQLNIYADKTIYNFTEMTRNIGTFTAAGVDLDTSVSAIQGIANLAAVSGSTSQQASTAMYQLSQALATGKVKLQDWNSVVNAGMGGQVFQDALKRTATVMGTNVDALIEKYGSFRDSLTQGEWLTTEVLTKTLDQFTMAAKEGSKEWENYKKSLMDEGYTEAQANEILKMANTATDAATKVKTFTQLWDVLKESAQSGWSQSWKLIIGDFEEAKALLTPLADTLTGFINRMSDFRNRVLEVALDFAKPWTTMMDKLGNVKKVADSVGKVTDKLEYFQEVVNKVWRGDYKNSDTGRFELLEKAGYDHRVVQDLVNKGHDYKLTVEDIEASHKKFGLTMETTTEETKKTTAAFEKLSDQKLKDAGLTEDEIDLYRAMEQEADRLGISVSELADEMSKNNGRSLLIDSFKNFGDIFVGIGKAAKTAWIEVFNPPGAEVLGIRLYGIIKSLNEFSEKLRLTDKNTGKLTETGDKIMRTFKGVFAIIDMVTTVLGGGFKIAFKVVSSILSYFNMDILDLTARIGDTLVKFRDWTDSLFDISGVLDSVVPAIQNGIKAVKGWIDAFKKLPQVQKIIDSVGDALNNLKNIDLKSVGKNIVDGLKNGLGDGAKQVLQSIIELGKKLIEGICNILGIHSPSTVFMAIGGFIIAGLIMGLKDGLISVPGAFQGIFDKCIAVIQNIDWGTVFALGVSVVALTFVKKIGDALEAFAAPFEGFGDILEEAAGVVKSFGKVTKAVATNIKTKALKNLAVALAIIAGVVITLTFFDTRELLKSVGIIAILAAMLVGLAWAASKMSDASVKIGKEGASLDGLKQSLIPIAAAILILGATAKLIGSMHPEDLQQGFIGMAGIMAAMLVFVYGCKKITDGKTDEHIHKIGKLMTKLSIAMLLMIGVVKLAGKLSVSEILKGTAFVAGFTIFIRSLSTITKGKNKYVHKLGSMMIKMAIAMGLMIGVMKLVDALELSEVVKGAAFAAGFVIFVKALVKAATVGKDSKIAKLGGLLLSISISMGLMVGVCKLMNYLRAEDVIKGIAFAAGFVLFVKALVKITTVGSDTQLVKVAGTVLAMSIAIGILAGVAMMLSLMNTSGLAKGVIAVAALGAIMSLMIHATKGASDIKGNLIAMTVAIALMAAAVAGLSFIDPTKLAGATLAMSILMGMFALMTKASENVKGGLGTLIVLTVAVAALAGVLWLMSTLDVQNSLANAAGLSILLVAVSASMFILSKMSVSIGNALKGVLALTAMTIPMLAFVGVLAVMNNIQNAMSNAQILTTLMTTMTLLLIPLTIIGYLWIGAAAGVVALTAMAIPMLTFIGVLALMNNIQNATSNATLLISLMTTMTDVLVKLAIIGPLALIGVGAMQGLTLVMAEIGILAVAVGALVEKFPSIQSFIDTGLPLLEQLAGGVGSIIGSFASGFLTEVTSGLPQIGTDLSMFMTNALPFIDGARLVDAAVMDGVKTLAETILILTAADILTGITSWISGGSSLSDFGAELATLGTDLNTFVTNLGTFDESKVATVRCAANAIKAMAEASTNIDGQAEWTKKLFGDNSITTFSAQLPTLATNLNSFVTNLGSFDESKTETIKCAVDAIAEMAKVANEIPNEGGWAAKIFGDNGLGTFSDQLPSVGTSLNSFATNLGTFDESKVESVKCAAKAIKEMATAATGIDGQAGWAAKLFGDNSIATFGSQLPSVGTNLAAFVTNLGTFSEDTVATVKCAANAIKEMAIAGSGIDGQSEWAAKLFGDNGIATFSSQFGTLGTNLNTFATNLGTFDESKVTTVKYAIKAVKAFADLADADLSGAKKNISGFGDKLSGFATDIASFCSDMPSGESVTSAITSIRKIIKLVNDIANADASSLESFTKSLSNVGKKGVDAFVKAFTSSTAKTDAKKAAKDLVDQVIKGVESKEKALKTAFTDAASEAADAIDDEYDSFYDAGSYLVDGFADGISENDYKAAAKAAAMAEAAKKAAEEALGIQSPSKVFYKIGEFTGQGLVNALKDYGSKVYSAGSDMADSARSGLSDAISKVMDYFNGDMDVQPTIRPVLDLSNVKTGTAAISDMLGYESSIGVSANARVISRMMNSNQNGGNSDIISAIDKLRQDISGLENTTYQINGINYNNDSAVSEAIEALVRAATMERRM